MKKFFLLIFLLTPSLYASDCFIESYDKIIHQGYNKRIDPSIIQKTNCDEYTQNKFLQFVINTKGTFRKQQFEKYVKQTKYKNIFLTPSKISVREVSDLIHEKLGLGDRWKFEKTKLVSSKNVLLLNKNESINIECDSCHSPGIKNVKISWYDPLTRNNKNTWATTTLSLFVDVLTTTRSLSPDQNNLTPKDVKLTKQSVTRPEQYFTNKEKIIFYKVNKPIGENSPLKYTDLTAINLVNRGIPAKIILNNNGIILQGVGIPSMNGKHGETIQLKNKRTNKNITGKVVDFNKVVVEI